MAHIPHLWVEAPWDTDTLELSADQQHHLRKVLRMGMGSDLSYTDGAGTVGRGILASTGIERGTETSVPRTSDITVAASPPRSKQRARFLVEKLAELGIERLLWIRTGCTEGRPPAQDKAAAWAVAGLEQSRGAWLMQLGIGDLADFDVDRTVVADMAGSAPPQDLRSPILIVGPEGGLADEEVSRYRHRLTLGPTVLRVETAAVVGATLLLYRRPEAVGR